MPTIQQQAARMTEEALAAFFRTARHIPEDKLAWSPMGEARTAHSQIVECTLSPRFFLGILSGQMPDMSDPAVQQKRKEMEAAITSVDIAETMAKEGYEKLCAFIEAIADDQLSQTHHLPLRGGMTLTTLEVIFLPQWNLTYHTGQINYLQTMLGDKDMH